ncbi:MAG TPA: hypothetical protein VF183_12165 [Acidimicrobiales bacterium]
MSTITTHVVKTKSGVAIARHRAVYAWCLDMFADAHSFSFMPNTKHLRLREPSLE